MREKLTGELTKVQSIYKNLFFLRKKLLLVFIFSVLIISIPLTVLLAQQTQDLRQEASEIEESNEPYSYEEQVREGMLEPAGEILEVSIRYSARSSPPLRIEKIEMKTGYAPTYPPVETPYKLQLVSTQNQVIYEIPFVLPTATYDAPPEPGKNDNNKNHRRDVDEASFAITVPSLSDAASVRLLRPNGSVITQKNLAGTKRINNRPKFKSRFGDEVRNKKRRKKNKKKKRSTVPLVKPAYASAGNGYLDIAFIGDGYADMALFHKHVDKAMSQLLTYEPFKSRASQIRAHYVDSYVDLYCRRDIATERLAICNNDPIPTWNNTAHIIQTVNSFGVPYDQIVVVWNNTEYQASGGTGIAVISGANKEVSHVFPHEFGHSFGGLTDEYILSSPNQPATKNCSEMNPNPAWTGIVTPDAYHQGCNYEHWWRSSEDSIMRNSFEAKYFNAVSQTILNQALDQIAGQTLPTPTPDKDKKNKKKKAKNKKKKDKGKKGKPKNAKAKKRKN